MEENYQLQDNLVKKVKNLEGNKINNGNDMMERWKQYFEELLCYYEQGKTSIKKENSAQE